MQDRLRKISGGRRNFSLLQRQKINLNISKINNLSRSEKITPQARSILNKSILKNMIIEHLKSARRAFRRYFSEDYF